MLVFLGMYECGHASLIVWDVNIVLLFSLSLFPALCSHLFSSVLMQTVQTWNLTEDVIPENSSHGVCPVLCNKVLLLKPRHNQISPEFCFSKPGIKSEGEHLLVIWYGSHLNPKAQTHKLCLWLYVFARPLSSSFPNKWNWKSANMLYIRFSN